MPLSKGQQGKYRQLVDAAYAAEAQRLMGDLPPKNDWRRQINLATTGCYSTKEMKNTTDFDAVMLELAILADDTYWIGRLSSAVERRIRWVITKQFIPDLELLEKRALDWQYCKSICNRMGIPDRIEDCPAQMLIKVLQAVDTHIRRLAKREGIELIDLPSGYFRKGVRPVDKAQAKYRHDHHHHVTHNHGAAA
jgi:hypothetical protein